MDSTDIIGTRTDSIFDDEIVNSRVERQADLQGAFSSGGGYCPDGIPVETAIFAALAAFGVSFGILYRAVTVTTGGRKKRDVSGKSQPMSFMEEIGDNIADIFWWGMNCFSKINLLREGLLCFKYDLSSEKSLPFNLFF